MRRPVSPRFALPAESLGPFPPPTSRSIAKTKAVRRSLTDRRTAAPAPRGHPSFHNLQEGAPMTIEYSKSGKIIAKRFSLEELEEASDSMSGFCLACGESRDCCEPDARRYKCESCDNDLVFGAEEIALMGYVK
jgi:hypothetical protein